MTYRNRLYPWCIVHLMPDLQRTIVSRFRRRNDAEAHLKVLRQMSPGANYIIIFDTSPDGTSDSSLNSADLVPSALPPLA